VRIWIIEKVRKKKKIRKGDTQKIEINPPQKTTAIGLSPKISKNLDGYKSDSVYKWQEETSCKAEEHLKEKSIQICWHYNDIFGNDFNVLALRAGGAGAVFIVKSTLFDGKIYAAKTLQQFLQEAYLEMPTYQQKKISDNFLEEVLPWLHMGQHPNIVPVHLVKKILHPIYKRNVPFVFLEFMELGNLKKLLIKKRFQLEEAISVALQICEALIHAYDKGLSAHKDLKLENIMISKDGGYRVTDFSAGTIGTPGYMAPEQVAYYWRNNRGEVLLENYNHLIDHHADQFAIGIIILELLTGKHPFPGIKRVLYSKEEALKFLIIGVGKKLDNLPIALEKIITRCLSSDPNNRFSDISSLKESLLNLYEIGFSREYHLPEIDIDDSPRWWFYRGDAFYSLFRFTDSEKSYRKALERMKRTAGKEIRQARCLLSIGHCYLATSRFSEAEIEMKNALKILQSTPYQDMTTLAGCFASLGKVNRMKLNLSYAEIYLKRALEYFHVIPEMEGVIAECLVELGCIYEETYHFDKAENCLKEAIKIFRTVIAEVSLSEALRMLGNAYYSTSRPFEALNYYNEALTTLQSVPGTEVLQGKCLQNIGLVYKSTDNYHKSKYYFEEALRTFQSVSGMESNKAQCFVNLGNLLRDNNPPKSIFYYNKAIKEYPELAEAYYNRAHTNLKMKEYKYALYDFDKLIKLESTKFLEEAWELRGLILGILGRYKEALISYDCVLKINPEKIEIWEAKGCILHKLGRYEEALISYDCVLKINPKKIEIWEAKGCIYHKLGRLEEANTCYDKILEESR